MLRNNADASMPEQQTYFRSSLPSEGEKRRPGLRLLFAGSMPMLADAHISSLGYLCIYCNFTRGTLNPR